MNIESQALQEKRFAKITKDKYYFRYESVEANRYCYVYINDQGGNEHPMTEAQYRAIRGIFEVEL